MRIWWPAAGDLQGGRGADAGEWGAVVGDGTEWLGFVTRLAEAFYPRRGYNSSR